MREKLLIILSVSFLAVLSACGGNADEDIGTITFADPDWSSIKVHNFIQQTILEEGYGYETDSTSGRRWRHSRG
ncbi:hypothetical protein [Virgibacillus sp. CBA3643]|uniref:hypothetical protein n=1 Tax=Virgibacillus sp. CBA3643 TaxID=2942278 RepID=UPI0035A2A44E